MRKRIVIILMMSVMMTGCSNVPYIGAPLQDTAGEENIDAGQEVTQVSEVSEAILKPETLPRFEAGNEQEVSSVSEAGKEQETNSETEVNNGQEVSSVSEAANEQAVSSRFETGNEQEVNSEAEAVPNEETPVHTCSLDAGSAVTVLAFGQHEPNCFYGAEYAVKCSECGKCLDTVYRGPLGHTGNEGVMTCRPDCTGEGSIRYTCIRCGAEWSEAYGQVQPHAWVEGIRKETDWINGGTKEIPYLYCSVCGKREENE